MSTPPHVPWKWGEGERGGEGRRVGLRFVGGWGLGAKNVQARIRRSERDGVGV